MNTIVMQQVIQAKFSCVFDNIKNFPFGNQFCSMKFGLNGLDGLINLKLANLTYEMEYDLEQYVVYDWKNSSSNHNEIILSVLLQRQFLSILMVTYLPTILMNIINQAIVYNTSENKYDLVITVNITCMMVLSSIYLSVSSSLPKTPGIKPVEVWLLFNLVFPFLVITTNALLQVITNTKA